MIVFHIITFFALVVLYLNAFEVSWAHDLVYRFIYRPKSYLEAFIVPVSWLLSTGHLMWELAKNLEEENEKDSSGQQEATLTEEERMCIKQTIESVQKETIDKSDSLSQIIGLEKVKQQVKDLKSFIIAQEKRKALGLPVQKINLHLVFTGNPGTGKTTVAREVAQIYKKYGLLSKGHLVETDRSGLVGQYLGQTAIKTKAVIEKAMGGILFIDEAYSLTYDNYGNEAIDALIKEMEDKKGKFAVIVAGYPQEMENFLNSNPGLKSRFSRIFHFEDYAPQELLEIFELFCRHEGFVLQNEARYKLADFIVNFSPIGMKGFGNGRYMRNLFELIVLKQSERIANTNTELNHDIQNITGEDVEKALADLKSIETEYQKNDSSKNIGFKINPK